MSEKKSEKLVFSAEHFSVIQDVYCKIFLFYEIFRDIWLNVKLTIISIPALLLPSICLYNFEQVQKWKIEEDIMYVNTITIKQYGCHTLIPTLTLMADIGYNYIMGR